MMRTALLLSSLAIAGLSSAQVFQSGFENWADSLPVGWMGSKTNIAHSAVTQVSDNVHGGQFAVRLANTSSTHKRFSTQPMPVADGHSYQVSFWVRGAGDVRVGLFDGRPGTSSGYAPYSPYATASGTWVQVIQTVVAANDTTAGEFIISVRNTVAPEHVVIDDVNITEGGELTPTSIYAIQYTTDPSGNSPLNGQVVLTGGIVTADLPAATDGYFIQSGSGPWTGIYVFDVDHAPAIGDSITFTASVTEYFGLTELSGISGYTVVNSGNTVVPFTVATGDVSLEPLESVLVRVQNATCTEAPGGANFGKYKVNDGSGDAVIGKVIYTTTPAPLVGNVYNITGVNYYAFSEYNIEPRMESDVEFSSGVAAKGELSSVAVGPNPASDLLTINLGEAAGKNLTYTLTDMQGRTVQGGLLTTGTTQLKVNGMPAGLYHLTLRSPEGMKIFAVQVAH